jgi:hypothetical protein
MHFQRTIHPYTTKVRYEHPRYITSGVRQGKLSIPFPTTRKLRSQP